MVLNNEITKKICDFVKLKPRSIQEIAIHIKKNWRTAERYIERIKQETGTISLRIFRKGTRGALKIVYWNAIESIHSISFQQELLERILRGLRRADFSPFEIYQYVSAKNKEAYVEDANKMDPEIEITKEQDLIGFLEKASKQVLIFSGNLSWINASQEKTKILKTIKKLAKRNVDIKIIARVSMIGAENVKKLMVINKEIGRDVIEIRHRYQPLRGILVDNKMIRLREIRIPEHYDPGELKKKIAVFYDIFDKEWVEWLQKVFWKMFATALPSEKRTEEIERMHNKII